jgi:RNA polymerase sigma-70 factor (ECF subfamily)
MRPEISPEDLKFLLHEAELVARRLIRTLRLSRGDLDDVRQDLLADLIARLPSFDAERGSLGAFANVVLTNRAHRLAERVRRERGIFGVDPLSLDEVVEAAEGLTRGDLTPEADGFSAFLGQPVDAAAITEQRIDAERGLGLIGPDDRSLCAALSHKTIDRLAISGRGSRASLYRRVKEIRFAFTAYGLAVA